MAVPLMDLAALFRHVRPGGSGGGAERRIAIVTTDDRAATDATLRHLGVRTDVAAMVCGDDGFAMKPAPDPIFALCQALATTPDRVAVIGDTPADVAMGRAAGVRWVIAVRSGIGTPADLADADLLLGSVAELVDSVG
jgi:phosphoglycolate phosphatase-like HAD superfamily hydrolase